MFSNAFCQEINRNILLGKEKLDFGQYSILINKTKNQDEAYVIAMRSFENFILGEDWQAIDTLALDYMINFKSRFNTFDTTLFSGLRMIINNKDQEQNYYKKLFLSGKINTRKDEYNPIILNDGKQRYLYFTGYNRDDGEGNEDVFVAKEKKNKFNFSKAIPISINTNNPEALSYVKNGNELNLLFYGNFEDEPKGNVYQANFSNFIWSEPEKLSYPVNTDNFEGDGIYFKDEFLVFVSDREGLYPFHPKGELYHGDIWGNSDIYVVQKLEDNKWSPPINLGKTINTSYGERSPWLSEDGLTLYFSSDGHPGLGRMDVYKSTRTDLNDWTNWTVPHNLGIYINTPFNDVGFRIYEDDEGVYAFFASSKHGKKTDYDIGYVELSEKNKPIEKPIVIYGNVTDSEGSPIGNMPIIAQDPESGEILNKSKTNEFGKYQLPLPKNKSANIFPESNDFIPQTKTFNNPLDNKNKIDPKENDKIPDEDAAVDSDVAAVDSDNNNLDSDNDSNGTSDDKDGMNDEKDLGRTGEKILQFFTNDGVYRYLEPLDFELSQPKDDSCDKQNVSLTTVHFSSKSWILNNTSKYELSRLTKYIKNNSDYFIIIAGHTDSDSTTIFNQKLSEKRADSVKEFLISSGVDASKLYTKGHGEEMPVDSNESDDGKYKNRRVEFCVILSKPYEIEKN